MPAISIFLKLSRVVVACSALMLVLAIAYNNRDLLERKATAVRTAIAAVKLNTPRVTIIEWSRTQHFNHQVQSGPASRPPETTAAGVPGGGAYTPMIR